MPEAAKAWRAVTARSPNDAAAFASLGVVLSKQQKYAEAASAYRRALTLDPKLPGVALNLGLVVFLVFRLYKKNLELDAVKRRYLAELRTLKGLAVERPRHADLADRDAFRDDFQHN